jgi:Ca2+-binding EF-hand superfamily protein
MRRWILPAFALLLACPSPTLAEGIERVLGTPEAPKYPPSLLRVLTGQRYEEAFVSSAMAPFRIGDADNNGVAAREIAEKETVRRAERRANFVASYLKYDLDGDGRVTKAEMQTQFEIRNRMAGGIAAQLVKLMTPPFAELSVIDCDGDGALTIAELVQSEPSATNAIDANQRMDLTGLMVFDADGNGTLTAREFKDALLALFTALDADSNGHISDTEFKPVQSVINAEKAAPKARGFADFVGVCGDQSTPGSAMQ